MVNCYLFLIGTITLNDALKKKKTNRRKFCKTVNFCSSNLTKSKKKFRKITKCHNIFTITLFSAVVSFGMIYYYLFYRNAVEMDPQLITYFYPSINSNLPMICCEINVKMFWT